MKNLFYLLLMSVLFFTSCSTKKVEMTNGTWRGTIQLIQNDKSSEMPFIFQFDKKANDKIELTIINADEKILVYEINIQKDSIFIKLPVFKDEIHAQIISKDSIKGEYFHSGSRSKYSMPFFAVAGVKDRFPSINAEPALNLTGKWETTVEPGDSTEYKMIGEFVQNGKNITGTFLTTSGDYRYLDGIVDGNELKMSSADGTHTLLFKAEISKTGTLEKGVLIGGPKWKENWIATKNDKFQLPKADSITKLKKGIEKIEFTFSDLKGNRISLSDEKYKNRPVIVQLMGSWCPNCMDETKLFNELYDKYKSKGLNIIGLCFESNNFEESKQRIERFVSQLNAKYDFLYAGEVGRNIKETLPFIEKLNGYPTTLYLDKEHRVVKIYTGFSGPGTGKNYLILKDEIIKTIESLL